MKIVRQINTIITLGALAFITACAAEPVKKEPAPVAEPAPTVTQQPKPVVKEQPKPVVKKREYVPMEK